MNDSDREEVGMLICTDAFRYYWNNAPIYPKSLYRLPRNQWLRALPLRHPRRIGSLNKMGTDISGLT